MNLLSISQICDQDFMVLLLKGKCLVMDESRKKLISSVHTLDNCYYKVEFNQPFCWLYSVPIHL